MINLSVTVTCGVCELETTIGELGSLLSMSTHFCRIPQYCGMEGKPESLVVNRLSEFQAAYQETGYVALKGGLVLCEGCYSTHGERLKTVKPCPHGLDPTGGCGLCGEGL